MAPFDSSQPDSSPPTKAVEATGYVRLARRLTAWTSNLLATGIVLVLALGGGRQLVRWYQEEPVGPGSHAQLLSRGSADASALEVELTSGGYALRRESLSGPVDAATQQLQRFCRLALSAAELPNKPATESERRFLATLAGRKSVEELPDNGRIYRFAGSMPMVVGVRDRPLGVAHSGPPLAQAEPRVLAWGIAVPSRQNEWFLYQYRIASDDDRGSLEGFRISLPAQSRRTLALAGSGERTIGLAGDGSPDEWRRHFDRQFNQQGWTTAGWQTGGGGWHVRYEHAAGDRAEVHFAGNGGNRLNGLVIITREHHE